MHRLSLSPSGDNSASKDDIERRETKRKRAGGGAEDVKKTERQGDNRISVKG